MTRTRCLLALTVPLLALLAACGGGGDGSSGAAVSQSSSAASTPIPVLQPAAGLQAQGSGVSVLTLKTLQPQTAVALVALDPASYTAKPGDALSYTITSGTLPLGVTFDGTAGTVQGTPPGVARAMLQVVATLTRAGISTSSAPLAVELDVNSSLVSAAYSQPCSAVAGSLLSCTPSLAVSPALTGESISFIAPDLPAGFSIDPASGTITGTAANRMSTWVFVTLRTTYADGSVQDDLPSPQPLLTLTATSSTTL